MSPVEHEDRPESSGGSAGTSDDVVPFRVVVRVRPPLPREFEADRPFTPAVRVHRPPDAPYGRSVTVCDQLQREDGTRGILSSQTFGFDTVYDQHASQKTVYVTTAREAVLSILQGYNATMIAYGQTGTGKTYTMEGFTSEEERGIIPRATEEIFSHIQTCPNPRTRFLVRASYLQIYNEVISDLIRPEVAHKLVVREDRRRGVYVDGLTEWVVRAPEEVYELIGEGGKLRMTGATRMSEMSSRSHAIFTLVCEQGEGDDGDLDAPRRVGKLNIVDLAGSEKVRQSAVTGLRLEESKKINLSLSALGNVICALTDPHARHHVPYRDSKLTRILADSLGGNCRTTMIAMISPSLDSYHESLSTLKFASRARSVRNQPVINDAHEDQGSLRRCQREVDQLRKALALATATATATATAAPRHTPSDTTALRDAVAQTEVVGPQRPDEDRAAAVWAQQLLLWQRDVTVALTARLAERDAVIATLEDELDAYDGEVARLQRLLEERQRPLGPSESSQSFPKDSEGSDSQLSADIRALCQLFNSPDSGGLEAFEGQLAAVVQREGIRYAAQHRREAEEWRTRYEQVEERRRMADNLAALHARGDLTAANCGPRVKELMMMEAESLRRPYLSRIATLDAHLQAAEQERLALQRRIADLESHHHTLNPAPPAASSISSSPNLTDNGGYLQQLQQRLEAAEQRFHAARLEADEAREALMDQGNELAGMRRELERATRTVEHHTQEKTALRIILEEKVRRRVDAIGGLLTDIPPDSRPPPIPKAEEHLRALRALLAATVRALGDDVAPPPPRLRT